MNNNYNPFDSMTFTYDRCFLCGDSLNEENSTEEHIFPKWLQNKFNLWDKELVLLNGTHIKYSKLKIPCCKKCNNDYLSSKLEKKVQSAVEGGYNEFKKLDENIVARWLAKLSYGMLFKELSLKVNIRDSRAGNIVSPEFLGSFKTLFLFLQSIIFETEFIGTPWSVLIFNIDSDKNKNIYDAQDLVLCNCFFMRMNDIGIIANLQDGGYQREFFIENMREFLNYKLHYVQFKEICAKIHYKSALYKKLPYFLCDFSNSEPKKYTIITEQPHGEVFNEWVPREYAEILAFHLKEFGIIFEDVYFDDNVMTYLYDKDGLINKLV